MTKQHMNGTGGESQPPFFHTTLGGRRLILAWNAGIRRAWRRRALDVRADVIDMDIFIFLTNLRHFVNSYTQHGGDGQILEGLRRAQPRDCTPTQFS